MHSLALRAAGVSVLAVHDPDRERAEWLAELSRARVARSFEELSATEADIAAVCSPPRVHVDQARSLSSLSGRTVLVEKPVATNADDLMRLERLPRCVPILQWRAGRALRVLRRAVREGELGDAPVLSCDLAWARDAAYFEQRRGWGCGALLSIGIHAIDAMVWALDRRIERVSGVTNGGLGACPESGLHETAGVAVFELAKGAMATLRLSLDGGADRTRIVACGRGKTAIIEGGEADPTGTRLEWVCASSSDQARLEALERETRGAIGAPLLVPYLQQVVAAIRDGEAPGQSERLTSIADVSGAHAAAIAIAALGRPAIRP